MIRWTRLVCGILVAALACGKVVAEKSEAELDAQFKRFTEKVKVALGAFHDIQVFERDGKTWKLASPKYVLREFVPVTVNDEPPPRYEKDLQSDRPMMLPTHVEGFEGGDGQSSPYSVVGRMPGSNPEVQWTFAVRQYWIKKLTDDDFATSPDMAVIGHHPRTGASVYLQYYDPKHPKDSTVVVSPFGGEGREFYSPLDTIAKEFKCQRCHVAGPFIHTPWINQARVSNVPMAESMVPSAPLGPFFFIDSDEGELFEEWNDALLKAKGGGHLRQSTDNERCTVCHRVAPDLLGLNQNASRYAGLEGRAGNNWSVISDSNQTPKYQKLRWMPPLNPPYVDFYAGQEELGNQNWQQANRDSAAEVNNLMFDEDAWKKAIEQGLVDDIPRAPKQYQTIVVDRPNHDQVPPKQSLWVVDSRMRANTAGDLHRWRFFAPGSASKVLAAPVVYRRRPGDGSTIEYKVMFVGAAHGAGSSGGWVSIQPDEKTFQIEQGDYLGVVFTNTGDQPAPAPIPYTVDDWAKLTRNDELWMRDGSVTYWLAGSDAPAPGKTLSFTEMDYRTYSYEFESKLPAAGSQ